MSVPSDGNQALEPRRSLWKKPHPRKPGRKPKAAESWLTTIDRLLSTPVQITLNGETKTVSAIEAIISQLQRQTLAGNDAAYRVLLKYYRLANFSLEKRLELTFIDNDYTRALSAEAGGGGGGDA